MSHAIKTVAGLGSESVSGCCTRVFSNRVATVLALVLLLCLSTSLGVQAERATPQEMEQVCQNWLTYIVSERGSWAGETNPQVIDVHEIIVNDTVLGRCFSIAPQGYVVVPVLKELPPVKASSDRCGLDVSRAHGMPQLLREVLMDRIRAFAKTYGSLDAKQPSEGDALFGAVHGQQWDRFLADPDEFETKLQRGMFAPADTVGPLLGDISWHQGAPFNYDCPPGDGGQCVVGCVATAAAQIMAYYRWPEAGDSSHTYYWPGDYSCGGSSPGQWLYADFSDPYDWENIPDDCHGGCTTAEQDALAELNYEAAVAFEMEFGHCGSGVPISEIPGAMKAFETNFRYREQMIQSWRLGYTSETWFNLLKAEINEGRPVWYFITTHSMVCDGWRLVAGDIPQYHINYGWDSWHTTWWTLDEYYCPVDDGNPDSCFQQHEFIVRNIAPNKGVWLSADTTFGWVPFDVHFTGLSEYSVASWMWDYGDGENDTVPVDTVTHTYDSAGIFSVTLTVDTSGGTLSLERPEYVVVLADSMVAVDTVGEKGDTVEVVIRAKNTVHLRKIIIPVETFGSLNVTHSYGAFSTVGCRTQDFETQAYQHYDPGNKRFVIRLESSSDGLEPGDGPILKVYYIIPGSASSGQIDTVEVNGYNQYKPTFTGTVADTTVQYEAVPVSGTISLAGCCNGDGKRGDADYSGGGPNVGDISYLVDYLFGMPSGPEPPCFEEGDVDASGSINVGDISYLVDYIFGSPSGPAPPSCP